MANSAIEVIYTKLKEHYEPMGIFVRYPYSFDATSIPYIYMQQIDDGLVKNYLCDSSGGITRISIGYLSKTFEDCVDFLQTIQSYTLSLIGVYSPVTINQTKVTSELDLTSLDVAQEKIYRRQFDVLVNWTK